MENKVQDLNLYDEKNLSNDFKKNYLKEMENEMFSFPEIKTQMDLHFPKINLILFLQIASDFVKDIIPHLTQSFVKHLRRKMVKWKEITKCRLIVFLII